MENFEDDTEHPRKRRRRSYDVRPTPTQLLIDENLRGASCELSDDLWAQLFLRSFGDKKQTQGGDVASYLGIRPSHSSMTTLSDCPWTIISVSQSKKDESSRAPGSQSGIHISPAHPGLPTFLKQCEAAHLDRHLIAARKPIEIRVCEVEPLSLKTIYVTVKKDLLQKVDEVQGRFGGGFHNAPKNKQAAKPPLTASKSSDTGGRSLCVEDRLTVLVRKALSKLDIVHSGALFALPLPSHPITHVPPPPALVVNCEPVSQGLLSPKSRIILIQAGGSEERILKQQEAILPVLGDLIEDDGEDTTNEQFYSAAEDRQTDSSSEAEPAADGEGSDFEESAQSHDESDEASDDSLEDIISLSGPGLPEQASGTMSAMTTATPRPGRFKSGVNSPGSVYSNYSSATNRANRSGKQFRVEVLLQKMLPELIHPRPISSEDETSFVFVDINSLAKIGCFSGDWVRLESSEQITTQSLLASRLDGSATTCADSFAWRPVRIFGVPGLSARSTRYAVDKLGSHRSSFSQLSGVSASPVILISPILFSNIRDSIFVKISTLPELPRDRVTLGVDQEFGGKHVTPPIAKEVTLRKVLTPLSLSREHDAVLLLGLKQYFDSKSRVVKKGDLIAIPIDERLGETTFNPSKNVDSASLEEQLAKSDNSRAGARAVKPGITWFCIERISLDLSDGTAESLGNDPWSGAAVVEVSSRTRIPQTGGIIRTIPVVARRTWEYWFGYKTLGYSTSLTIAASASPQNVPRSTPSFLEDRLCDLIRAATNPRATNLGLPPLVVLLHSTQRRTGKSFIVEAACLAAGVHVFPLVAEEIISEGASTTGGGDVKTEGVLISRAERALSCGAQYTALLIQHIEAFTADRMVPALQGIIADARVVIATTTEIDKVPDGVRSLFTHEFEVTAPNEHERETILKNVCLERSLRLDPSVNLGAVALKTAAFVAGDLVDVVDRASIARSKRLAALAEATGVTQIDIHVSGGPLVFNLTNDDFNVALSNARSTFSDTIGAPKIPSVTWDDVGGLAEQKSSIMETISLPLSRPELFAKGMRKRSGILFYGPPGTGKTLLAKAIATEFSLNFFSVKGPELLNMYIGESEANVRRVFQKARDARPCVVFFDELDSVAPKRGNQGDSGGVMDRIVSQLLAELDGMSSGGPGSKDNEGGPSNRDAGGVFVIGATNRPDLLDPALLRPGRFDKMLYLGVSSTHEQQATILEALTRNFILSPDIDLGAIAHRLPLTYTGADLYALCSDAMLKAISRRTRLVDENVKEVSRARGEEISTAYFFDHFATEEDANVVVREEDFFAAQSELIASVSAKELAHFEQIRNAFEQQDISKSSSKSAKKGLRPPNHNPVEKLPSSAATPPPMSGQTRSVPVRQKTNSISKHKGKGKGIANPDSGPDSDGDDSDPYMVKTAHLNGSINGVAKSKGKAATVPYGFLDTDEDLYS